MRGQGSGLRRLTNRFAIQFIFTAAASCRSLLLVQTVYIETTIPSYLAAKPSSVASISTAQQTTHLWWNRERVRFRLFTSVFTIDEASRGDATAAKRRINFLEDIPDLEIPEELPSLEADIIRVFQLPQKAYTDASHLGLAILHRMDYLLTWNCTHLANAVLQKELMEYCQYHRLHLPIVCTPDTLISTSL